jgi:tetratricopeptide (TPR) repeat protein
MTSAKDTQTPVDSAGGGGASRKQIVLRWAGFLAVCAGLFAGMWYVSSRFRPHEESKAPHDEEHAELTPALARKKIEISGSPTEVLSRGDQALTAHRFAQALDHFAEFLTAEPNDTGAIAYRVGLCNESLGRNELAIDSYRKTIGGTASPALGLAGHLGMARCLLRQNRSTEVRQMLVPFLLDEQRQEKWPPIMIAEARYLVALSFGREANHDLTKQVVDDEAASSSTVPLEVPFYFDEIVSSKPALKSAAKDAHAPKPDPHHGPELHPTPAAKKQEPATGEPAVDAIDRLAKDAHLSTKWSDAAKKAVASRTLIVVVKNPNAIELAEMAADAFGLCCHVNDGILHLATRGEADAKQRHDFQHRLADRALRAALIADSSHALTPAAYVELGNLNFASAHWNDAAGWYERVVREAPASPYTLVSLTNLARMRLHQGDYPAARRDFFRVIDESPGHELALQAQARIGQLDLESDSPKEAIQTLHRTQALAGQSKTQPLLSLVLAAAYLQKGDPEKARTVLLKSSKRLRVAPYKTDALILDALAQLRLSHKSGTGRREASELLSALLADAEVSVLGAYGQKIMAESYLEVGLANQAERMYRLAAKSAKGPLASRVQLALAEVIRQQGRDADAAPILTKLAESSSPAKARARYYLAEIDFEGKRFPQSAERCRQLWADRGDVEPTRILQLWGSAFERMGDIDNATKCYAGEAPTPVVSE